MKRQSVLIALAILAATHGRIEGEDRAAPRSIDKLLSIHSVVGGETPQWYPDGSRILFASGLAGGGLMTIPAEGGFPVRVPLELGGAGHFLAQQMPQWSPDGQWIAYVSDKSGSTELWLWSVEDGRDVPLTALGGRINAFQWSPDSGAIAFSGDRYGNYDIWTAGVPDGRIRRLTANDRYEVFPSWTPDGQKILYVELDEHWVDHTILEMTREGEGKRVIARDRDFFNYRAGGTFGHALVPPDGKRALFRSHRSGWINYWTVSIEGGEPRPIAPEEADQSHARWSPDGRSLAFVSNYDGTHVLRVVSAEGGEARDLVRPELGVVSNPEWSPDGKRLSYLLETPTRPADLHVVDAATGVSRQLTVSLPAGGLAANLAAPEKIRYPSTEGFEISAYLYKPARIPPGERLPGILWIHGGPTSQFNDTFQQHVQFFVEHGYVLLLPNIRGSSGYGKPFEDANNGCWGHCDLEDVLAGVDYLKGLPYVNPDQMGITGTSYGGCMSMAAVAFAPGVFQAAIPASGYADWIHFMEEQELRHIKLLEYEFGPLAENEEMYRKNSPLFFVEAVTTPTFLVHGEGLFPRSEASLNFAQALERHYKAFRYKAYPGENYYVRGKANRRQMLLDMLDFFDSFLKDRIESPPAPTSNGASR